MTKQISIIIPAFNEEKRLPVSLQKIITFLTEKSYDAEIVIVDDGSSDNTSNSAEKILSDFPHKVLKNEINRGKGYSVKKGMLEAEGDLRLFSDADLSTPIEELPRFIEEIQKGFDIVIASRGLADSQLIIRQSKIRELMGRTFNKIVQFLLVSKIKDTQCGFKLFKVDAAEKLFSLQKIDGWAFDVEILYLAQKLGYEIKELPVQWLNSAESKVQPITTSIQMFLETLKIRWQTRIPKN